MNRIDLLLGTLDEAVRDRIFTGNTGVLFSGGIDSSVVAALAARHSSPSLYTVGVEGASDLTVAKSTAEGLGLDWVGVVVGEEEIRQAIKGMVPFFGSSPLTLSFEMPLYLILGVAAEDLLLCGQGADELYAGYSRYRSMEEAQMRATMSHDLEALIAHGMGAEKQAADSFGKMLIHPFLDPEVVKVSLDLPLEMLLRGDENKAILRDVGRALGLGPIADRKKKAAQYGSGIMNAMKKMAKRDGLTLGEMVDRLAEEQ
ncbi:MAG TPA: asparagine synthase C-terminal domain-containing protein [Methanomassiliicoccales archaeon]